MRNKVALIVGHKASSQGAVNASMGTSEFEFNNRLASKVALRLATDGRFDLEVVFRDTTYAALPAKVNATGATIAISMHCNAFDTRVSGSEVLYCRGSVEGAKLARGLQREIVDCLGATDRGIKPIRGKHKGSKGDLGGLLVSKTTMPCVIVEPFFIDHTSSLIRALDRIEDLADAYADGITGYLGLNPPKPIPEVLPHVVDVAGESVFDFVTKIKADDGRVLGYEVTRSIEYFSPRYQKAINVTKGDKSDGATSAPDLDSFGWIFHDELCTQGKFTDGIECTNLQASAVLGDILAAEGRWFRRVSWFAGTWLFGGGKARKNGMF